MLAQITGFPVKQSIMAIPDPTQTAHHNWTDSCVITGHLVADFWLGTEFRTNYHAQLLKNWIAELHQEWGREAEEAFGEAVLKLTKLEIRQFSR